MKLDRLTYEDQVLLGTAFKNTIVGKALRKSGKFIATPKNIMKVGTVIGGLNPIGLGVGAAVLVGGGATAYYLNKRKKVRIAKAKKKAATNALSQSTNIPVSAVSSMSPMSQQLLSFAKNQIQDETTLTTPMQSDPMQDTAAPPHGEKSKFNPLLLAPALLLLL